MEDIVFNAKVEGANSLKQLKDLYKEQQVALGKAEQGTKDYQKALENLGKVKDEIGDLKNTINSLNPEGKVAAFQNVAGKLAGGFQAATGAAALFGSESEELEKTLLKVQAATAFAEGIQSVAGLSDAFAVLKATLLSFNPILLAITVAVAAIGAAYLVWSENMSEAAKSDALLNAELERQKKLQDGINANIQRELDLKRELGLKNSEINQAELEAQVKIYAGLRTRQLLLQQIRDKSTEQSEELQKLDQEEQDAYNKITILKIKGNKLVREEEKKAAEDAKAERDKAAEEYKKILEEKKKAEEDQAQEYFKNQAVIEQQNSDALKRENDLYKAALDEQNAMDKQRTEESKLQLDQRLEGEKYFNEFSNELDEQVANDKKQRKADELELEKQNAEAKTQIINTTVQAAKALSDAYFQSQLSNVEKGSKAETEIRKKQFNVNKAFSIASAVIDGIRGVQAALTIAPPAGPILAVLTGVLAAANVARIAATKFDAGGASGSIPASPGGSASVPTINTPQTAQPVTKLNADGTTQTNSGNQSLRAYVVESDITSKQEQMRRVERQSQF